MKQFSSSLKLITLASLLFQMQLAAAKTDKTDAQYWKETGLTLEIAARKLDANCYQSSVNLLACIQAINVLAYRLNLAVTDQNSNDLSKQVSFATPEEAAEEPNLFGAKIKDYGPISLYQVKVEDTSKKSRAETWKEDLANRQIQVTAVQHLFANKSAPKLSVATFVNALKPQILFGKYADTEGLTASEMLNTYLSSAVDPHTHLDSAQQDKDGNQNADQSFFGIGMTFGPEKKQIVVMSLTESGTALSAGIKRGDVILAVDGKSVANMNAGDVRSLVVGPENTQVKISVMRKDQPLEFLVTRKKIVVTNVTSKMINDSGKPVAYIQLKSFMDNNACASVQNQLNALIEQGATGLILDLRNNGGGLVDQGVCLSSLFIGAQKIIVWKKDLDTGVMHPMAKVAPFEPFHIPMVTLINSGSASASEIMSGALQDYGVSWMAGDRSYGKATVQSSYKFQSDGSADFYDKNASVMEIYASPVWMFRTIARFYQPTKRTNQIVGILPDFAIDPVPNATEDQKFALHEADYYTNALPALGAPWVNPRLAEIAPVSTCLKASGTAAKIYAAHLDDPTPGDFQIYSAEEILRCSAAQGEAQPVTKLSGPSPALSIDQYEVQIKSQP